MTYSVTGAEVEIKTGFMKRPAGCFVKVDASGSRRKTAGGESYMAFQDESVILAHLVRQLAQRYRARNVGGSAFVLASGFKSLSVSGTAQ